MAKRRIRRERRKFTAEFKAEVGSLVDQGDRALPQVCRDLDLTDLSVRRWVEQSQGKKTITDSRESTETDKQELVRLRAENKRLKMESEILKKATAFFVTKSN